jgi:hypothetical protein
MTEVAEQGAAAAEQAGRGAVAADHSSTRDAGREKCEEVTKTVAGREKRKEVSKATRETQGQQTIKAVEAKAAGHEGGAVEAKARPKKKGQDIVKVESEAGEEPMLVLDDEDELYFQDVAYALGEAAEIAAANAPAAPASLSPASSSALVLTDNTGKVIFGKSSEETKADKVGHKEA